MNEQDKQQLTELLERHGACTLLYFVSSYVEACADKFSTDRKDLFQTYKSIGSEIKSQAARLLV